MNETLVRFKKTGPERVTLDGTNTVSGYAMVKGAWKRTLNKQFKSRAKATELFEAIKKKGYFVVGNEPASIWERLTAAVKAADIKLQLVIDKTGGPVDAKRAAETWMASGDPARVALIGKLLLAETGADQWLNVLTQDTLWTELRENKGGAAALFRQSVSIDTKQAAVLADLMAEANGKVSGKPILVLDRPLKGAGAASVYPKVSSISWRFVR